MIVCRVIGEIYSTINHPILDRRKLLIVEKLAPGGRPPEDYLVAIDAVDAGVGQTVLVIDEGNSARQVLSAPNAPTRSVIVGIIDAVDLAEGPAQAAGTSTPGPGRARSAPLSASPGTRPASDAHSGRPKKARAR